MNLTEYHEAKESLLKILNLLAPTRVNQSAIETKILELERSNIEREYVIGRLARMICDGIFFGEWPS